MSDKKCSKHLVTQGRRGRKAEVCRVTSSGREVWLCKKCDGLFGRIVGVNKSFQDAYNLKEN